MNAFKLKYSLWVLLFAIAAQSATAQTLKVRALFDSTAAIKIGDQVRLRLEVEQSPNMKVTLPIFTDTVMSKIEVVKALKADTTKANGLLQIKQDYIVTSFDSGVHTVAPLKFLYTLNGRTDTLKSEALHLQVFTLPVDTLKDIRDIKPILSAPISFAEVWPYLLGVLALIGLGFLVWFLLKRKKGEKVFNFKRPQEPAHIIALRELEALRADKLWQQGKEKAYYTQLTEVLRAYIERRFQVIALEMTSDEIIVAMKRANIENPADIDLLQTIFNTADLVKFAKALPLPDENEVAMLNAFQFVNNTKLYVQPQPEQAS